MHNETTAPAGIRLRPAGASDQPAIKQLIRDAQLNPMGLAWRRFTLAVDPAGAMIGCVQYKPHRDGSCELASLVVVRAWQRRGVAAALVHHIQQQPGPPLWLMCGRPLAPFYRQFGFLLVDDPAGMPPYFRRIQRLVGLFSRRAEHGSPLAIMHWPGPTSLPAT
ncbi:MAG: GNAT family N-acetyltransferase [Ardenticatenaceae bacterium]|nr:GNAT family N-acetyltransferase [Ardenticatenaceae bacterium]